MIRFILAFVILLASTLPALAGAPDSPLDLHSKGVEFANQGRWKDAIKHHTAAHKAQPNNKTFQTNLANAHLQHGNVLQKKGKFKQALAEYRKALKIDPSNSAALQESRRIERMGGQSTPPPSVE